MSFASEYGRAVAVLARVFGDIDIAEEAVQEAFATAVARWPDSGLPPAPAGWIITTARNRAIDRLRREASRDDRHAQAALLHVRDDPTEESPVQDDRLRLIFTCCHPALSRAAQVALTLRLLGGLTHPGDRAGVPRARGDDGAANRPREGEDPRRPDSVPGPERGRPARATRRGAGGRVSDLQRGLRRQLRRAPDPRGARDRGDPPRTPARRADARRARGARVAGADAAPAVATRRAHDHQRRARAASRTGPRPLGPRADRGGTGARQTMPAAKPARPLPAPGRDQRRPQRRPHSGRHRLETDPRALRPAPDLHADRGRGAQPGRRGRGDPRPAGGAPTDRRAVPRGLLPLPRDPGRPPTAPRRAPTRLRPPTRPRSTAPTTPPRSAS